MKPAWSLLLLLFACNPADEPGRPRTSATPQIDPVRWSVLDGRDRRDTAALRVLLQDSLVATRAQAALALASVGAPSAVPALLQALSDPDAVVRAQAAFAFGFCGDSVNVHQLIERFSAEPEPAVRGRIAEAAGRCGRRNGADLLVRRSLATRADSLGVLRGLFFATTTNRTDTSHLRFALSLYSANDAVVDEAALQVAARSPSALLKTQARRLLDIAMTIPDSEYTDLRLPLLAALGRTGHEEAFIRLQEWLTNDPDPRMRVMALRGLGRWEEPKKNELIWKALQDSSGMVRDQAVEELLRLKELPDGQTLWTTAQEHADHAVKIPLYGLVMRHGDADTRRTCGLLMRSMAQQDLGPYLGATLTKALHSRHEDIDSLKAVVLGNKPPAIRQAALEQWFALRGEFLKHAEIDQRANDEYRSSFMRSVLLTGDAGLIAAICERLKEEEPGFLTVFMDKALESAARAVLHPIRDLETIQLLDALCAKRDGLPEPKHQAPPFNHPIDRTRLASLYSAPQYRINTSQGEIVLELEPMVAPGSCVAFDSLVAAGYYNGRYYHRVVPDFVAQGGCPRGDGYGGMPWTLRTEVGMEGFTTGAVGLASAGKDTESCQFFIMLADAPHLDGRYTRFAHVVRGMEVAWRLRVGDRITAVERMVP